MIRRISVEHIPEWALCYLINGDATGLTDDDQKLVDEWLGGYQHIGSIDFEPLDEGHIAFDEYPTFGKPTPTWICNVFDDSLVVGDEAEQIVGEILESDNGDCYYPAHCGMAGYYKDKKTGYWVAFDNGSGCCYIEEFDNENEALDYVNLCEPFLA